MRSEWKLVPVEPTAEMYEAGEATFESSYTGTPTSEPNRVYRAMLAAAPSPEWVKTSERLPTREDADELGKVWCAHRHGWGVGQYPYHWVHDSAQSHWLPKPRQQPPKPPEGE